MASISIFTICFIQTAEQGLGDQRCRSGRRHGMIMEVVPTVVRLSHYQHPQKTFDLCDEKGLVAWSEIPLIDNITDSVNFSNTPASS